MNLNVINGTIFLVVTIIICFINNSFIKKINIPNISKNKIIRLCPLYFCCIFWILLIIIDIYVISTYYIKDISLYSPFGLFWNLLIIIGVLICHLHSGLFIYDAILTINSKKRNVGIVNPIANGPLISILIPSCNELESILKPTLEAAKKQNYFPYDIILIENSSDNDLKNKAMELAKQLEIKVIDIPYCGSKAKVLNIALQDEQSQYIAILDADQITNPDFLSNTIPYLLNNKNLAFVQTAQDYRNLDESIITMAAAGQQYPFYNFILTGRSLKNAAFSVGTNVLFNIKCLKEINGFNEQTVTEDIATSYLLHKKKYDTLYLSDKYAYGYGPVDFSSYLIQQKRWANGTISLLKSLFNIKKTFSSLTLSQWLRYTASALYYLSGLAAIIFLFSPVLLSLDLNPNKLLVLSHNPAILTLPFRIIFYSLLTIIIVGGKSGLKKWFWQSGMLTINASVAFSFGLFESLFQKKNIFKVTPKVKMRKSLLSKITLSIFTFLWIFNIICGFYLSSYISLHNIFSINLLLIVLVFWTFINCINTFSVFAFYNAKYTVR